MQYNAVKIEAKENIKYLFPEEVVDLFEAGVISPKHQGFVADIVKDAETVKPVEFDSFSGFFDLVIQKEQGNLQNIKTELTDKMRALMTLYGKKFPNLSNSEIREILNDVLTLSQVRFVYDTKVNHNLGVLTEDGTISPNTIKLSSTEQSKEKI